MRSSERPPSKEAELPYHAAGGTRPKEGRTRERPNDDAFLCDPARGLFAVADGVSGSENGHLAAQTAIESARTCAIPALRDRYVAEAWMQDAFEQAQRQILEDPSGDGRATTLAMTLLTPLTSSTHLLTIGHAGDSRVTLLKKGSYALEPLTIDHSPFLSTTAEEAVLVREMILHNPPFLNELAEYARRARISVENALYDIPSSPAMARELMRSISITTSSLAREGLSPFAQLYGAHQNYISSQLGMDKPEYLVQTREIHQGDLVLLTTDGVHDGLTPDLTIRALLQSPTLDIAVQRLLQTSTAVDDRTAVVLRVD